MQIDAPSGTEPQFDSPESLEKRNLIQDAYGTHPRRWFRWVSDRLSFPLGSRLLELGSGDGSFWLEARDHLRPDWRLVLSDRDGPMAAKAAENLHVLPLAVQVVALDAQQLPFASSQFAGVLAIGLFDLVDDLDQVLREVFRVLAPGGCLVCSAGGNGHLRQMESLVRSFVVDADLGGRPERFGLENGEGWLSRYFSPVVRHMYKDELIFRRAEPVIEYVLSEQEINNAFNEQERLQFISLIKQKLIREGPLRVSREKGLFFAWKPDVVD